jgi:deazaflavin-dependent oxidoreductase (nitroreductase family)
MTSTHPKKPPRGWKAWFWRAPIWLYRWHLGWLLGKRFLLLTHTGRKSGLPRYAVLEIIKHDAKTFFVSSGFGEKAQWYQNILQTPEVRLEAGREKFTARAERLSFVQAKEILSDYARKHPFALKELSRVLGLSYNGSEASLENLAKVLPIIAFHITGKVS